MAKKRSTKVPTSKAETAYELLTDVCRVILDEPRRYAQACFIARPGGRGGAQDSRGFNKQPACGTMGCIAGWIVTLKQGDRFSYKNTRHEANQILGMDETEDLFAGNLLDGVKANQGTMAYARAGVTRIRAFQNAHATQLKAKRV